MAGVLPIPIKTWLTATVANTLTGSDTGNQKDLEIRKKNQRKLWPGQVVLGSNNGTTGARDGVDRWLTTANIVSTSWFLFGNGNGSQDCLYYSNSGQSNWFFVHSPGGLFTGGTSSARPTASDETVLYNNSFFGRGGGGSTPQFRCNMECSTDGQCLRMFYFTGGIAFGNVLFEAVEDPTPGWATPNVAVVDKNGVDAFTDQNVGAVDRWMNELGGGGTGIMASWGPAGAMPMTATFEGTGVAQVSGRSTPLTDTLTRKNGISGTYRMPPSRFGLFRNNSGGADDGWHGRVFDIWGVPHGLFAKGSTVPLDGSKQFVIIGDQMFPWAGGGTAFLTS